MKRSKSGELHFTGEAENVFPNLYIKIKRVKVTFIAKIELNYYSY